MRVLIFTGMFPPNQTGTSFYSKNLAESLVRQGVQVELVTTSNKLADSHESYIFKVIRIPSFYFPLKNYFKHLRFVSFVPRNYFRIRKIARKFKPDFILLINHYLDMAFLAVAASKSEGVPLYISIGTQLQSLNPFRNKVLNILDRVIVGKLIFPHSKGIICWDKEIERYIKDVHSKSNSEKSVIIPFGVNGDIRQFDDFENPYDESGQILGVGAIIGHRDYLYQIRVFYELQKTFPALKLKIIGNKYISRPEQLVNELGLSDKVIFTGELPHEEVLKEYQKSIIHWMMLCGKYVGLGTSTIEAMLMGVPVISNVPEDLFGAIRLSDMENYIFTDGDNIETDTVKISRVLTDRSSRMSIGKKGKEFVRSYLNWDSVAIKFKEDLFKDLRIERTKS